MSKIYKIGLWEEQSGYVTIKADSEEEARAVADEILNEHGLDKIFNPSSHTGCDSELAKDLMEYEGEFTHGCRDITELECN